MYMQKQQIITNPETEVKLKIYKRGTSMVDIRRQKLRKAKVNGLQETKEVPKEDDELDCINEIHSDDEGHRAKSIHAILRPDEDETEVRKVSDKENKNFRKQMINEMGRDNQRMDEEQFEDSKAAQLAAANSYTDPGKSKKAPKKEKVIDEEE